MSDAVTLQKALYTIKKLKHSLELQQKQIFQPVAIVGLSCRFPDACGKEAYWDLLKNGKNVITKLSEKRWEMLKGTDEIFLRDEKHPYWGGFLPDIAAFDAYFFGISPREALRMDPQHRLLLEVAYEAIEDAGLSVESLAGSNTGVFSSLYVSQLAHQQTMDSEMDALYLPTGNAMSIAANRISYLFDLRGPSMVVDSACSSSMVLLHLACLNLQNNLCDTALVCGAKLNLLPYVNYVLSQAKMLSPDGQCKTFDAHANGYVQGEGVGVIVVKPLANALRDKDRIYAVITGSAVNQDGKTNGLTAPNGLQQERLLKSAYAAANIDPLEISYVECHGTGTFLGDPIEIQALGEVVGKKRDIQKPCLIGSVKTNIGHLEPAAGIASIIKVALSLQKAKIPPHVNFSTPNPHIAFDKHRFRVPQQLEDWPHYAEQRIAGVSGFGFGGTNAHIVMREVSAQEASASLNASNIKHNNKTELFTLSAKDSKAFALLLKNWCSFLAENLSLDLSQLCYNVHIRRSHYPCRLAIIASTTEELYNLLCKLNNSTIEDFESYGNIFINIKKTKRDLTHISKNIEALIAENNLSAVATLYVYHSPVDWKKIEKDRIYAHMDMPLYPWQHKDYWPPLGNNKKISDVSETDSYPLRGKQLFSPLSTLQFEFSVDTKRLPDIPDTYNILHAGYYLEMLAFAVKQAYSQVQFTINNMSFLTPLLVPDDKTVKIQLILEKLEHETYFFRIYSYAIQQKKWLEHANGKLLLQAFTSTLIEPLDNIKQRCLANESAEILYKRVIDMGMPAGESIRWTHQYWFNAKEILCEFQPPKSVTNHEEFELKIHPSIFDACIQPIFRLLPEQNIAAYIAANIEEIKYFGKKDPPFYLLANLSEVGSEGEKILSDFYLINKNCQIIAECKNIHLSKLGKTIQLDKIMQAKAQIDFSSTTESLSERKQKIIDFLMEQAANIFSLPKEDIDITRSLHDIGMDSLLALVLVRTIEVGLGTTYPLQTLLEGASIAELADFVLNSNQQIANEHIDTFGSKPSNASSPVVKKNPWIAYRQPQVNAAVRLFCFPYGGGGASVYREWQQHFPDSVEVCPIQLPAREERMHEPPVTQIETLLQQLVANLQPELNLPFVFFGHSFGSLLAFELTRYLQKQGLPLPQQLFMSAFPDPRNSTRSLDNLIHQLKTKDLDFFTANNVAATLSAYNDIQINDLVAIFSEHGLVEYSDQRITKDIIKVLLPLFAGDMNIVKSYQYYEAPAVDIPITVFSGKRDAWVLYEEQLGWEQHTRRKFGMYEFDSGHLFIRENEYRKKVIQIITNALA